MLTRWKSVSFEIDRRKAVDVVEACGAFGSDMAHGIRQKMLIVEGVSNSGKTTLCRRLNKEYGFVVIDEGIRFLEREIGRSRETFMRPPKSECAEKMNQRKLYTVRSPSAS